MLALYLAIFGAGHDQHFVILQCTCSLVDLKTGDQSQKFKSNKATVSNPVWDSGYEFSVTGVGSQALQIALVTSSFSGR